MSVSSISIKVGNLEVSCSASEDFLKTEFPSILEVARKFFESTKSFANVIPPIGNPGAPPPEKTLPGGPAMTITSISAKLKVESGSDLLLAACVSLTRSARQSFSRKDLTQEMRQASGYFKESYVSNLSKSFQTLIGSGKLLEVSKEIYALSASALQEAEVRLA